MNGVQQAARDNAAAVMLAVGAPLAAAALALTAWLISDRLLDIGPLDRAAFGWLVVVPLWVLSPLAAGFAWSRLSRSSEVLVVAMTVVIVGLVAAGLFWLAVAHPGCDFGTVRGPADWLLPSLVVGGTIGGGFGLACVVSSRSVQAARPWRALVFGGVTQIGVMFTAILVETAFITSGGCQRPPV